jgi:hypothetical protein
MKCGKLFPKNKLELPALFGIKTNSENIVLNEQFKGAAREQPVPSDNECWMARVIQALPFTAISKYLGSSKKGQPGRMGEQFTK